MKALDMQPACETEKEFGLLDENTTLYAVLRNCLISPINFQGRFNKCV